MCLSYVRMRLLQLGARSGARSEAVALLSRRSLCVMHDAVITVMMFQLYELRGHEGGALPCSVCGEKCVRCRCAVWRGVAPAAWRLAGAALGVLGDGAALGVGLRPPPPPRLGGKG